MSPWEVLTTETQGSEKRDDGSGEDEGPNEIYTTKF